MIDHTLVSAGDMTDEVQGISLLRSGSFGQSSVITVQAVPSDANPFEVILEGGIRGRIGGITYQRIANFADVAATSRNNAADSTLFGTFSVSLNAWYRLRLASGSNVRVLMAG